MPNDEYIKRRDAVEALCGQCRFYDPSNDCKVKACFVATRKDQINAIPAADIAEVRHGEFIGTEFAGYCVDGDPVYSTWECSECWHAFEGDKPHYKYCPNCGAKMSEENDNE